MKRIVVIIIVVAVLLTAAVTWSLAAGQSDIQAAGYGFLGGKVEPKS